MCNSGDDEHGDEYDEEDCDDDDDEDGEVVDDVHVLVEYARVVRGRGIQLPVSAKGANAGIEPVTLNA